MKVNFSVFFDGERRPSVKSQGVASVVLGKYVSSSLVGDSLSELGRMNKVSVSDRKRGVKIVLTSTTKKVKVVKKESTGFLRVELEGRQSIAHIKVAAVDKLKSGSGWHRTVCEVVANGLVYKVKAQHKGVTWTTAVASAEIVSKRAA